MAEPDSVVLNVASLQKLPLTHIDPTKGMFETADPDVPTTSKPLTSGRSTPKKKKLSLSDESGKNVCNIKMNNVKSKIIVNVGDNQTMTIVDDSESSSGDSIGSKCSSQGPASSQDPEQNRKTKKNCRLRIFVLFMIISGCVSGVVAWIIHNNYVLDLKDNPTPKKDYFSNFPDKCESNVSTASVGEPICITHTQEFTSSPSRIHVRQVSSQYLGSLQSFTVNVSSNPFVQEHEDVIIGYNSSGTNKEFRFALKKATCDNMGKYNITFEYSDEKVKSLELKFLLKETKLKHSVNRINDSIHVHCEMKNNCKIGSVNLFVNDGDSSRVIPTMNDCNNPDRKSSSKMTAEAIIPVKWFSGNQTISCVPLMTDPGLAANLTSTMSIPVCEGDSCEPNCKDDPHGIAYFQDKHLCNIFYQCSNGDIFLQNCSNDTSWSHSKCTCDHFDDAICDWKTFKFFQPAMSFEKCTKSKQVL